MMVGFIEAVPVEIEQAAMIDGCSVLGALVRIVVPLTRQGIAATAILAFIASWNNFLFALVLSNEQTKTLPVAVLGYIGYNSIQWGSPARGLFPSHARTPGISLQPSYCAI
jgi:multiple sugar transport system permease protein